MSSCLLNCFSINFPSPAGSNCPFYLHHKMQVIGLVLLTFCKLFWDPNLGPPFGTPTGPQFGTLILDPKFWTPIWDPDLGPQFGTLIWDPYF
jgi:hypothetical protein